MATRGAVVILALALSGCLGGVPDEAPSVRTESDGLTTAVIPDAPLDLASVPAPVWNVGDAWSGSAQGFGDNAFTLVVTQATGTHYVLETTAETSAAYDAMYDISYIGRIRVSDLAGEQEGTPVQFFAFPLEDGKTWTTTWDSMEVALTATRTATGYKILGTAEGEPYVEYDYSPELRWWSRLHFVREDYGITISRAESAWKGTIAAATAKTLFEGRPAAPVASPGSGAFTVDEGQTFVLVSVYGGGSQWARAFQLFDPSGAPYPSTTIETFEAEGAGPRGVFLEERLPPTPGQWRIAAPGVHDQAGGFFVTVNEVAVVTKEFSP